MLCSFDFFCGFYKQYFLFKRQLHSYNAISLCLLGCITAVLLSPNYVS